MLSTENEAVLTSSSDTVSSLSGRFGVIATARTIYGLSSGSKPWACSKSSSALIVSNSAAVSTSSDHFWETIGVFELPLIAALIRSATKTGKSSSASIITLSAVAVPTSIHSEPPSLLTSNRTISVGGEVISCVYPFRTTVPCGAPLSGLVTAASSTVIAKIPGFGR